MLKKFKRLIITFLIPINLVFGIFSPVAYADALIGSALVATALDVDASSAIFPPLIVLGASLTLCSLVYAYKDDIATAGMDFNNYLYNTGTDISSWYSNNSITVNSDFRSAVSGFVKSESLISSESVYFNPLVPVIGTSVYTIPSSRYLMWATDNVPDHALSLSNFESPVTIKISSENSDGTYVANLFWGTSTGAALSTSHLVSLTYSLVNTSPKSWFTTAPTSTVTGTTVGATIGSVTVPDGTVFNPSNNAPTIGAIVGATPATLTQDGTISDTPAPGDAPPSSGSTSDFTGIFGWLSAILVAIQLLPTLLKAIATAISDIPTNIAINFTTIEKDITDIPNNISTLLSTDFADVVQAVQSIPTSLTTDFNDVIGGIQDIPNSISGFFDNVVDSVEAIPKAISIALEYEFVPTAIVNPFNDIISNARDEIYTKYSSIIPDISSALSGQEPFTDIDIDYKINFGSVNIDTGNQVIVSAKYINDNISSVRLLTSIMMSFFFCFYVYSEIYFMIRGVKPFSTSSSTTVNGKDV